MNNIWLRISDELAQAWTVTLKDIKVYYLRPGMIMFGFLMPFFMFFSFSVRREMAATEGLARLLALTVFFTAAAAGPFIIPTERRMGTYDRLLAAPMSLLTLLLGKIAVGAFFAVVVASLAAVIGVLFLDAAIAQPAAVHQRSLHSPVGDESCCAGDCLSLPPDVCSRFDEFCHHRRGVVQSMAGFGRIVIDRRIISAAIHQAAPARQSTRILA